jgi:predicted nuclease with TOPRIM domain
MEIIILILGLLGFGAYQFKKRQEAEVESKLSETKGKDSILVRDQVKIENEINKIDERLKEITEERKKQLQAEDSLTLEERADKANKKWN